MAAPRHMRGDRARGGATPSLLVLGGLLGGCVLPSGFSLKLQPDFSWIALSFEPSNPSPPCVGGGCWSQQTLTVFPKSGKWNQTSTRATKLYWTKSTGLPLIP